MEWTEEREAKLTELWGRRLTAVAIAKKMGDVTRDAVLGKARRLGLEQRRQPAHVRRSLSTVPEQELLHDPVSTHCTLEPVDGQPGGTLSTYDEGFGLLSTCTWPLENDTGVPGELIVCGKGVVQEGKGPYCEEHQKRARRPLKDVEKEVVDGVISE